MSATDDGPVAGLVETMLARDGRVPWLGRHLARMERSARALGLAWPGRRALEAAVGEALAGAPALARVRLVLDGAGARVSVRPEPAWDLAGAAAVSVRGAWDPRLGRAEHKALPRARWDRAQEHARAHGAAHALLLDAGGRLGEAAVGNVVAVIGGRPVTAPATGLLAGVARGVLLERMEVREEALAEPRWRGAEELFLTNAVRGVVPLTRVDGAPVGDGRPGPVAAAAAEVLRGRA